MLPSKYLYAFIINLIGLFFSYNAYGYESIAEIRTIGNGYIGVSNNPNIDSPIIGWIPEGEFVNIIFETIFETVNDRHEKWSQIEYKDTPGFIRTNLLIFYQKIEANEGKKGDIAEIKNNGNQSVYVRKNSNIDSPVVGCIPEGEFVKIISNPIQGNIGKIPGNWYQISYGEKQGFIWHDLLDIYTSGELLSIDGLQLPRLAREEINQVYPESLLKEYNKFVKAAEAINSDKNLRKKVENGGINILSFMKNGIDNKTGRSDQIKNMTCTDLKNIFNSNINLVNSYSVTSSRLIESPEGFDLGTDPNTDESKGEIMPGDLLLLEDKKKILMDDIRIFCDEPNNTTRLVKIEEVDNENAIVNFLYNDKHKGSIDLHDNMFMPKIVVSYSKRELKLEK